MTSIEQPRTRVGQQRDARDADYHPYYDCFGKPCTFGRWTELCDMRRDGEHQHWWRLGHDIVGKTTISTVWVGTNTQFGNGPPLMFETIVHGGRHGHETFRYASRTAAIHGHERLVRLVKYGAAMRPPRQLGRIFVLAAIVALFVALIAIALHQPYAWGFGVVVGWLALPVVGWHVDRKARIA